MTTIEMSLKVREKVNEEITEFRDKMKRETAEEVYKQSYIINVYEQIAEILLSDYVTMDENFVRYLYEMDKPLDILCEYFLADDTGIFSPDWDTIVDVIHDWMYEEFDNRTFNDDVEDYFDEVDEEETVDRFSEDY